MLYIDYIWYFSQIKCDLLSIIDISIHLKYRGIFGEGMPCFMANTIFSNEKSSRPHTHDFYEIFMIREGSILHLLNDEPQTVSANMLCFIKPADHHCFKKVGSQPARMTNMAFTPELYEEVMQFLYGPKWHAEMRVEPEPMDVTESIRSLLDEIFEVMLKNPDRSTYDKQHARIKSLLASLFIYLFSPAEENRHDTPAWLETSMRAMERTGNFEQGIEYFIRISGKSQEHLTRSLRKYYGLSPTQFINQLRLRKTAHLLRTTNRKITGIIFDSGFNNISYFNRIFKERYSCSPREYRKQSQQIIKPEKAPLNRLKLPYQ